MVQTKVRTSFYCHILKQWQSIDNKQSPCLFNCIAVKNSTLREQPGLWRVSEGRLLSFLEEGWSPLWSREHLLMTIFQVNVLWWGWGSSSRVLWGSSTKVWNFKCVWCGDHSNKTGKRVAREKCEELRRISGISFVLSLNSVSRILPWCSTYLPNPFFSRPQGDVKYSVPCLHVDFPIILYSDWD